jgi:hypothetical protein
MAGLVFAMLVSAGPQVYRAAEARPSDLSLLGAPLRGEPGKLLPRALGLVALGLAADRDTGSRQPRRLTLNYVARW